MQQPVDKLKSVLYGLQPDFLIEWGCSIKENHNLRGSMKMILADKIIEERKRNGWSQEELAEKLGVSRQSVSKWESAQSIPDITRIIQMAELFGVTTDYLLKDSASRNDGEQTIKESVETVKKLRTVSMEEASEFIKMKEINAPLIAFAVSLCILAPVLLIVLSGFADSGILGISENLAGGLGIVVLLIMVAVGFFIFISCRNREKKYDFLNTEEIETAYGVAQMAREKKDKFAKTFNTNISIGVVLCILCSLPLLVSSFLTEKDYIYTAMAGLLLVIIAIAVNMFVRVGIINSSYDKLLQEGDYTPDKKKSSIIEEKLSGIYWLIAVAIYLAWSFLTNKWGITWVVWPVAGVLYGAFISIAKLVTNEK